VLTAGSKPAAATIGRPTIGECNLENISFLKCTRAPTVENVKICKSHVVVSNL
jgi:hypothetical protein